MREIGKGIDETKLQVKKLMGVPLVVKINSGRGKSTVVRGTIAGVFPAVFTMKLDSGEMRTFAYSDVHTRGVLFLKSEPDAD